MFINRPLPYIIDSIIFLISVGGVSQPEKNDDVSRNLTSMNVYGTGHRGIPEFLSRYRRCLVGSSKQNMVAFGAVQISR
jgi:hypothetical protein